MKTRKDFNKSIKLFLVVFLLSNSVITAQENVVFDINNLQDGVITKGSASLNSCWLLDSDIYRPRNISNEDRFVEIGVGSLRFPYGHLADNYLWDSPPYGSNPLKPKIASESIPWNWDWAVNQNDGSFYDSMDFDEFMGICNRNDIEPLVVVNIFSYLYTNGPTYEDLKTTAVEWVKYAKEKGYKVAYWQIGNEVDHHQDVLSRAKYITLYKDFVTAMKAVDPSIVCGPGILGNNVYLRNLLDQSPELVDFSSAHQYLFSDPFVNYNSWLNHNGKDVNTNVSKIQTEVNNSSKPDLPILITESNSYGNWESNWPALYKGLSWFDMLLGQQSYEDVKYTYMWNSHSPWNGEDGFSGNINALSNTDENEISTMGWALKILNDTTEERPMNPDSKVNGDTYSYGSYTPSEGNMSIHLMNKSTTAVQMTVDINGYSPNENYERWVWTGEDQYDAYPTFTKTGVITLTNDGFRTWVPPHSLVVVKLSDNSFINTSAFYFINNVATEDRLKCNDEDTDVEPAPRNTDQGWKGKWQFTSTGDGYYYIDCIANNMRLQGTELTGEEAVKIVSAEGNSWDWVKWKIIPVGANYLIENKAHNVRLNIDSNGDVALGNTNWTGDFVQWQLTLEENTNANKSITDSTEISDVTTIYPNPVSSIATIENASNSDVIVYDMNGTILLTKSILSDSETIDLGKVPTGIYYVEVKRETVLEVIKLIKN